MQKTNLTITIIKFARRIQEALLVGTSCVFPSRYRLAVLSNTLQWNNPPLDHTTMLDPKVSTLVVF